MEASLFPAHAFWPLIHRRDSPIAPLFSAVNRRNFNHAHRPFLSKIQDPSDERLSSHAFRRCTSHDLKESGPPWSVVASSGVWHSPAFRGYFDIPRDVGMGTQQLFVADLGADSEAGEEMAQLGVAWMRGSHLPAGPAALPWVSGFAESVRIDPFS